MSKKILAAGVHSALFTNHPRTRPNPLSALGLVLIIPFLAMVLPGCDHGDSSGDAGGQSSGSSNSQVLKFSRVSVHDDQMNNIEAFSFLVPEGWKQEASIVWDPNLLEMAYLRLHVTDPQSGAEALFLSPQRYVYLSNPVVPLQEGTNYMGDIVAAPVDDLDQYVRSVYAPQELPELQNATLASRDDLPNVAAAVQKAFGDQTQVKAQKLRYSFDRDGQPWQEDVYLTLDYNNSDMGTIWEVYSANAIRAPKDQLDKVTPLMTAVLLSTHLSSDWYAGLNYVRQLFMQRNTDAIRDAAAISQTISQNSEEIRQEFNDSYNKAEAANDNVDRSFDEYVRGVNTYSNPYEDRPIQLPSGYNDAWVNANGEYILSNDSGYDPNVGGTTEWRKMSQRGENGQ